MLWFGHSEVNVTRRFLRLLDVQLLQGTLHGFAHGVLCVVIEGRSGFVKELRTAEPRGTGQQP
jgi:hypothetical protein